MRVQPLGQVERSAGDKVLVVGVDKERVPILDRVGGIDHVQFGLQPPDFVRFDGALHGDVLEVLRLHQLDLGVGVVVVFVVFVVFLRRAETRAELVGRMEIDLMICCGYLRHHPASS